MGIILENKAEKGIYFEPLQDGWGEFWLESFLLGEESLDYFRDRLLKKIDIFPRVLGELEGLKVDYALAFSGHTTVYIGGGNTITLIFQTKDLSVLGCFEIDKELLKQQLNAL